MMLWVYVLGFVGSVGMILAMCGDAMMVPWLRGVFVVGLVSFVHLLGRFFHPYFNLDIEDPFESVDWNLVKGLPRTASALPVATWLHLISTCLGSLMISFFCPVIIGASLVSHGYPLWFCGTYSFLLVCIWLSLQYKGSSPTLQSPPVLPSPLPTAPTTLRLLTHNMNCIYFGGPQLRNKKRIRLQALLDVLKEDSKSSKPFDVIFLQELFVFRVLGISFGTQLREWFINEAKSMGFYWVAVSGRSGNFSLGQDSGLVILSRYPLSDPIYLPFEFWTKGSKGVLSSSIQCKGGKRLYLFNMHLDAFVSQKREAQLNALRKWKLEKVVGEPVVIGGDLNMFPGEIDTLTKVDKCLAQMQCNGEAKCPHRDYSPVHNLWGGLDHFLISDSLICDGSEFHYYPCLQSANKLVSDHPGLEITITCK
eukprot:TRINITY_DN21697_c0_g1_i1.p1 TRINITY_DN21697_c0_g1~~TRINITY_DN21697_c0_g1_i1.p1  ORF type:complete len:422 (+),score=62.29 TRINITY_DN21697_c0_g1_i1:3-1268(+)